MTRPGPRGHRRFDRATAAAMLWRASLVLLALSALALPILHAQFAGFLFFGTLLLVFLQVVFRSTAEEGRRPL